MKTIKLTLFSLFIIVSSFSLGQLSKSSPKAISDNIIVRMQKNEDPTMLSKLVPTHFELEVAEVLSQHSDIWLLKFNDDNTNIDEVLEVLYRVNTVLFAQPNREVELRAAPNDPLYTYQWHHDNIDSELAWDITTGGTTANGHDIVIALIESADVINHPDLQDNQWVNTAEIPNNGIDDDGNGYVDDYNGWNVSTNNDAIGTGSHGTNCAGMMGAKGDNGIGVSGINWNVKIMDIAGHTSPFTESNIIAAYNYALSARLLWNQTNGASGAFVVATSASWGVDGGDPNSYPIWCSFYDDLGQAGILNAGATTNQNQDVDTFGDVPTGCASDYMIGVTATNSSDIIDFAGYGEQTINIAAPGSSIYTTAANGQYTSTSGTSFACPLTAGLIGLLYSVPCSDLDNLAMSNPQAAADMVMQALYNGVDQSQHLIDRTISGGRINAKNSIDLLMLDVCSSCSTPNNINVTTVNDYDASIVFDHNPDATSYVVSIQIAGTGVWTDYTTTNNSYTFTGLTSCTEYEFRITSDCSGEIGNSSAIGTFKTSGCGNCIDLNYCETNAINPALSLTVTSPASIQGNYSYQESTFFGGPVDNGYQYGELVLVNDGSANPNEGCNPLTNGAAVNGNIAVVYRGSCDFTDKAMNAQNAGATAVIVINNVANPSTINMGGINNNVTIPAIMISQADGAILVNSINNNEAPKAILGQQNEWVESFLIDGNTITTGDNNGYVLNDSPIALILGQNYPFTLTPGYDGQALEEYTRIWLDINQDGVFDVSEMIYDQGTAATGVLTDNLTIPATALTGSTRMRVQMAYQGLANSSLPDVCGDLTSGEVEDFCVTLSSGSVCGIKVTSTINDPACSQVNNGEISVNVTAGTPPYSYLWNNGQTGSSISNLTPGNYSLSITDGSGCDTTINFALTYTLQLSINETITHPSCQNTEDGSITVNANGGNNFTYNWNNGPSSSTWSGIGDGTYHVTASNDIGCTVSGSYSLSAPNTPAPTASFTTNENGLSVIFNNTSTNASTYLWDFGDGNTSTLENPTHVYAEKANYNICLTAYGECDTTVYCTSINVNDDLSVIGEGELENGINIYPNPVKNKVTIEKINAKASRVVIYNASGQLIDKVSLSTTSTAIIVSDWKPGVYFFHIMDESRNLISTQRVSVLQ